MGATRYFVDQYNEPRMDFLVSKAVDYYCLAQVRDGPTGVIRNR